MRRLDTRFERLALVRQFVNEPVDDVAHRHGCTARTRLGRRRRVGVGIIRLDKRHHGEPMLAAAGRLLRQPCRTRAIVSPLLARARPPLILLRALRAAPL